MQVLDHGYVKCVEHWGSDRAVIEAARMSTDKGFLGWTKCKHCGIAKEKFETANIVFSCITNMQHEWQIGDEKLLKYLFNNKPPHTSPFEFGGIVIEVQAPIFVFREWHRHRTQSYNEMSARYTPLPDFNYVPTVERCMQYDPKNKQAARADGAEQLVPEAARDWLTALTLLYGAAENLYQEGLSLGIPKEVARVCLPVGRYSRMRAQANLLNWLKFLTLRMDRNAQWEIRQYAEAVGQLVAAHFPRTWELFAPTVNGG